MKKILFIIVIFIAIVLVRIWNIETTSRFLWDESSDLVRMNQLFLNPKITLLGPMSEDKVKIFSSLTYYLTMPFVILGKFDPISPVWATIFFGVITAGLFIWLTKTKNTKPSCLIILLMIVSYPLVQASRWAWNPHFIPFWEILSLAILLKTNKWWTSIAGGLAIGLTIHHHYYALFATIGFGITYLLLTVNWKKFIGFLGGVLISISPFVIFDLTHPPGLFISRALFFSPLFKGKTEFLFINIFQNIIKITMKFSQYLVGDFKIGGILLLIGTVLVIFNSKKTRIWIIPVIFQICLLSIVGGEIYSHYLLPGVVFYYWWLYKSAEKSKMAIGLLGLLIIFNLISLPSLLTKNDWSTNIKTTREIEKIIINEYQDTKESFNIGVFGSPDPNTYGRKYRDLLNINKISVESFEKFSDSKKVFFISYEDWEQLKEDSSYELNNFRNKRPIKVFQINNSQWKIYLLSIKS
jgi:hypothetical protein